MRELLRQARLLLANSGNLYVKDFLRTFIGELEHERIYDSGFVLCLRKMLNERHSLEKWELDDLNPGRAYCFRKVRGRGRLGMLIINGRAVSADPVTCRRFAFT